MRLYRREKESEAVVTEERDFLPYLWLREGMVVPNGECRLLGGDAAYSYLAVFENWLGMQEFRKKLRENRIDHFYISDPVQQFLMNSGVTLFNGMEFNELRRMQVDLETFCEEGYDFPNPERPGDVILAIAMSDSSGWEEFLVGDREDPVGSEERLIRELNARIRERDPDVLEGHNLFNFDLPYLEKRAKRHGIKLNWGRDGSRMRSRNSRVQIAERSVDYTRFEVDGRHIVDTLILVQFYDIGSRSLESFGLKEVARHFGVAGGIPNDGNGQNGGKKDKNAENGRTELEGSEIQDAFFEDPEKLRKYALEDVRETRAISDLLSPSYFTQAQIFPYNYQNVIVRGNATRIDALFLREYLRQEHSIPGLPEVQSFAGGYTDVFITGVARPVWHCDVTSLYPSVMLKDEQFPEQDSLGIFGGLLKDLREFRIWAKRQMQSAKEKSEYQKYDALQSTFKILINSFYGYLGFSQAHFADFEAAAEVTRVGREILVQMVEWLGERGAKVIEIDTDGVYFCPPNGEKPEDLEAAMQAVLPAGIEVELDSSYEAMFSYKAKNYALLKSDGGLLIKGAALKSRGLEKFQREFMEQMIRLILEEKPHEVKRLQEEFEEGLRSGTWPVKRFSKTETLADSPQTYAQKIKEGRRNRAAAYELALASGREFRAGDQVSYYVTGTKKRVTVYDHAKLATDFDPDKRDENVEYYVAKLQELVKKFDDYIE